MNSQKILIVDDSEMNRDLLLEMLKDSYEIEEAENGAEAIGILSRRASEFSLVLLDIVMPLADGFDVLQYMKQENLLEHMSVIMISSDDSSRYISRAYEMGAFDYISRPFDAAVVRHRVSNTMQLYKKQHWLEDAVAEQIYNRHRNSKLMVAILSYIVEFRNGESGRHVINIGNITRLLIERLTALYDRYTFSADEIDMIVTASALHDIGKISIADEILNKPGRLTDEEFAVIKRHTVIGAEMLENLSKSDQEAELIKFAYEICRWHHERFDGNGYPDGLRGNDIPIPAQIIAVADVYDALTSERCYKKAFSHETAVNMILNGECGMFNPDILEAFRAESDRIATAVRFGYDEIEGLQQTKIC